MAVTPSSRPIKICPSLMCADLLALGAEVDELVDLGVDYLHVDIMDGHYVPNLTIGTDLVRLLAARYTTPLDIHLMVSDPDRWAPVFAQCARRSSTSEQEPGGSGGLSGEPIISIHPETTWHPARSLAALAESGATPAIAIDPAQQPATFEYLLEITGQVVVMSVNPGYAGQKFVPWTLRSIEWLATARERLGLNYEIEVDGNVSWDNIPQMVAAGADVLVAGTSSLFDRSLSRAAAHARLRSVVQGR